MANSKSLFLLTGSNLGERKTNLLKARALIAEKIGPVLAASHLYETQPWGLSDQPDFLNQALEVLTALPIEQVLPALRAIEHSLGSEKKERWGPRLLDIDILLFGGEIIRKADLEIPHPRLPERNFALVPLMEIAGEMLHPVLGLPIEDLFMASTDPLEVICLEE